MAPDLKKQSLILISSFLLFQSCGASSSSSPAVLSSAALHGVVAQGGPLLGVAITVKDIHGIAKTATSDSGGGYRVVVDGLTPPYLLKADLPSGDSLFSFGNQAGVVNIHPFTNLVIGTWYKLRGKSVNDAFSNPMANPAPETKEVAAISAAVKEVLRVWMENDGLDAAHFDLFSTPFAANHLGFDALLDASTITMDSSGVPSIVILDSTTMTKQTTTLDVDVSAGGILIGTIITRGSGPTATSTSVSVMAPITSNPPPSVPIAGIDLTPTSMSLLTGEI